MQSKKMILLIAVLIIFLTFAFFGCTPKSSELKKIMKLQNELAEKEEAIKELQQENTDISKEATVEETTSTTEEEKTSLTEEVKILLVIDSYINTVENKDFKEQKNYVAKYALDLVNFKEYEEKNPDAGIGEVERKPSKIDKIEGNKAEGFMSFTELCKCRI
ncbi:MAG: hypothetical protein M1475_08160 [Actinobacteria bacterium]|nr:hypothetical protein [Actinomycetota bacterium]MCL6088372.1 hypothetical protein [Actinomycetota bacterium]